MNPPLHNLDAVTLRFADSVTDVAAKHSAKVTDWGGRLLWTGGCLLFVVVLYVLMWRAWKRRARTQGSELAVPAGIPDEIGTPVLPPAEGRYFGTTGTGGWLDRVVAHGLGARSAAEFTLTDRGLVVDRTGAPGFFVPAADLVGARLEKAHAGKVLPEGGLVVVSWRLDGRVLESGFRAAHAADHDAWIEAVTRAAAGDTPAAAQHANHQNHQNHQEGTVK